MSNKCKTVHTSQKQTIFCQNIIQYLMKKINKMILYNF